MITPDKQSRLVSLLLESSLTRMRVAAEALLPDHEHREVEAVFSVSDADALRAR